MNILFYLHQYPAFGGIETVTTMLAKAFAADGHRVSIVSLIHKDGTDLLERLGGRVTWHELPEEGLDSESNHAELVRIFTDFRPEWIVLQDSYVDIQYLVFDALSACRDEVGSDCRLVVVEHSAPCLLRRRRGKPLSAAEFFKRLALFCMAPVSFARRFFRESRRRRELFDKADVYVAFSEKYRSAIRRFVGGRRMDKLRVIPNPMDGFSPVEGVSEKSRQILFVGSLIAIKGVDRLLSVWSVLAPSHPDWEFVIVGDGAERPRLEGRVKKERIRNVRFEGFQRDPSPYCREAAIFVMASDFEGWPMALGEAMRWGCVPVVSDSFAAASDMIDDNIDGRLIRHFSERAYVNAVAELMDDAGRRAVMADAARKKASRHALGIVKKEWYGLLNVDGGVE